MSRPRLQVQVVFDNTQAVSSAMHAGASREVAKAAHRIETDAKMRAPVDTGTLRRSIHTVIVDPLHATIGPSVEYGEYVEYGTRRMAAQQYLTPAVEAERPKFIDAMKRLVAGG